MWKVDWDIFSVLGQFSNSHRVTLFDRTLGKGRENNRLFLKTVRSFKCGKLGIFHRRFLTTVLLCRHFFDLFFHLRQS